MDRTKIEIQYNGGSFVFPVTPSGFDNSLEVENTSVTINGLGEMNLKGKKKLQVLSWSCFFPRNWEEWMQVSESELKDATEYVNILKNILEKNETVTVNISDFTSLPCTLESFPRKQDDGTGDIKYSVTFKEFRDVDTDDAKTQTAKRPTKTVTSHMYKWKNGDTWKKVAKKETGSANNWQKIKKANKSTINKAIKNYKKKHPNVKTPKEEAALVGVSILIK